MSPLVPDDVAGNVSAGCPHCGQSISAPGHDLTVMIRCPRCRAELRLASIIDVSTPLPAEVIPGTSLKTPTPATVAAPSPYPLPQPEPEFVERAEGAPFAAAPSAEFDAERTLTVDPLPRPKPPPPPSSRGRAAPPINVDATVLDPSVFGPFPSVPGPRGAPGGADPTRAAPSFTQPSPARPNVDATAFQGPAFSPPGPAGPGSFVAAPIDPPRIVDVDSTAPMSRPPALALTPAPIADVAPAVDPGPNAPVIAIAATPQAAPPAVNAVRARFALLDGSRRAHQLQFVIAVVSAVTVSLVIDVILGTGPFFRTIASLFTVSMAALWLLVVAASAEPAPDGSWSLGREGIGNVLGGWRRIAAGRARSKELDPAQRNALLGAMLTGIGAPLTVGFELLRFLQLAMFGFFGVGSGSAIVFNVLAALAASAALFGMILARRSTPAVRTPASSS